MKYKESIEQAAEFTRLALPLLARHKLPTDPKNYAVSYEYVSGKNQNLINAINDIEQQGASITPELSEQLYQYYLEENDEPELEQMRETLRRILSEILNHIGNASDSTGQFRQTLEKCSNKLVDTAKPRIIREIVGSVLRETKNMEQSNKQLEQELMDNTREMDELRRELMKAREEALIDTLTQLANRKGFNQKFESFTRSANDDNKPLSILIIDIDHFKNINDTHGHLVGDEILRLVARVLDEGVKGKDFVSRFGGDEFCILLPDTSLQSAIVVANSLIKLMNSKSLRRKSTGDSLDRITLSIGATSYKEGENLEDLIKRADDALYFSKQNGRNMVTPEIPK